MAVQIETRGQLQEFLEILSKRRWQVILPAAFVIVLGTAFAVLVPKKYLAKSQLELRPVSMSVSSKEASNAQFQIKALQRVKKVVQALKNTEYLSLPPDEQYEFLTNIAKNVKVIQGKGANESTNFINLEYADVDRQWATDFLKALRDDWIQDVLERDRNKLADEQDKLREDRERLQKQYERAERELTELKTKHGISATQPIPGVGGVHGEDPIYTHLQESIKQASKVELELTSLNVKIKNNEKRYAELPEKLTHDELLAGISNEKELKETELQLIDAREKLDQYRPAHPKWKSLSDRIEMLQKRREQLSSLVTKGELQTVNVPNPERAKLRTEIEADKLSADQMAATIKKLDESIEADQRDVNVLQDVYREIREQSEYIGRLQILLGAADLAYQQKMQQVKIVSSPLANPFEITEEVNHPSKATEPNPWIIIAFSLVAGLALGIGLAVALEYSRNCFRSVSDISRVMVVPVLGSINTIVTRREARLRRMRRTLVGVSSAAVLCSVIFVTWAWARSPDLLSPDFLQRLEALRAQFR